MEANLEIKALLLLFEPVFLVSEPLLRASYVWASADPFQPSLVLGEFSEICLWGLSL